ncbi:zinc finger protein 808-like [Cydia splendana]|uniref:zinc finger protein 808-like n=1 Tax=Cydia splendana TaxID=1100963 RepID=UPI00213C4E9A
MAQNNDLTSSLQTHFICDVCNKLFTTKYTVSKHLRTCGVLNSLKCQWCKITFKNRGNLVTHAARIHGDYSYKAASNFKCQVCEKTFNQRFQLTYHIRREHFNLQAKTPYCELKKINQVWFENVLNSNSVLEIKKTGHNTLVMRKLDENTGIKVSDTNTKITDLSSIYPVHNRSRVKVQCHICRKMYLKITIKKHMEEKHTNNYGRNYECNNCKRTFKRAYFFLQHVCNKVPKRKGKKPIVIESVQSLKPIEIS